MTRFYVTTARCCGAVAAVVVTPGGAQSAVIGAATALHVLEALAITVTGAMLVTFVLALATTGKARRECRAQTGNEVDENGASRGRRRNWRGSRSAAGAVVAPLDGTTCDRRGY